MDRKYIDIITRRIYILNLWGNRGQPESEEIMAKNDRYVVKYGEGWAVKRAGVQTPESVHGKQSEAERSAKQSVRALGGGEVRIQGRDGR